MSETLGKLGLIGIGVLAITEGKIRQTVDELIEKGEMNREEGGSLVRELLTEKKKQIQELGGGYQRMCRTRSIGQRSQ